MKFVRYLYSAGRYFMMAFVGLWALIVAWSILNRATSSPAELQRQRIEALSDENHYYCTKWGFAEKTHEFNLCVLDLDEVRQKERDRLAALDLGL